MDRDHAPGELVSTLIGASRRVERHLDSELSNIKGITFREYQLLLALQDPQVLSTTRVELAQAVGLSASGVTRALQPLEKLGFVETTRHARDARRSQAVLTDQGSELVIDATGVVDDVLSDLGPVSALSARDRDRIVGFLSEVARS